MIKGKPLRKKHNYPKTRKKAPPRNTDYSETQKVIKKVGLTKIKEILMINGIYTSAKILSSSMESMCTGQPPDI